MSKPTQCDTLSIQLWLTRGLSPFHTHECMQKTLTGCVLCEKRVLTHRVRCVTRVRWNGQNLDSRGEKSHWATRISLTFECFTKLYLMNLPTKYWMTHSQKQTHTIGYKPSRAFLNRKHKQQIGDEGHFQLYPKSSACHHNGRTQCGKVSPAPFGGWPFTVPTLLCLQKASSALRGFI